MRSRTYREWSCVLCLRIMAAIRHSIQKELFSPSEERLLAIVSVTKSGGRKKRYSFITLSGEFVEVCII